MSKLRLPSRFVAVVTAHPDYVSWNAHGVGAFVPDLPLFNAIRSAEAAPDGSVTIEAQPSMRSTIHWWAEALTRAGSSDAEVNANIRSGRAVMRAVVKL